MFGVFRGLVKDWSLAEGFDEFRDEEVEVLTEGAESLGSVDKRVGRLARLHIDQLKRWQPLEGRQGWSCGNSP